jgi:hypothetical protein
MLPLPARFHQFASLKTGEVTVTMCGYEKLGNFIQATWNLLLVHRQLKNGNQNDQLRDSLFSSEISGSSLSRGPNIWCQPTDAWHRTPPLLT